MGEEGWFTDVEWREGRSRRRKRAGFGARFDVSTAFRSACYSRIIVTGGTKRMRGSSVHFHPFRARTLCASRVSSQMETNLYAGGTPDRKKRKKEPEVLLTNWIDRLLYFFIFFLIRPRRHFSRVNYFASASALRPTFSSATVERVSVPRFFATGIQYSLIRHTGGGGGGDGFAVEIKLSANFRLKIFTDWKCKTVTWSLLNFWFPRFVSQTKIEFTF